MHDMHEELPPYENEKLDYNVQEKTYELFDTLNTTSPETNNTTVDTIFAQLTTPKEVVLFSQLIKTLAQEHKNFHWPEKLVEKLNQKLTETAADLSQYAQVAEHLGIEYQPDYSQFWQSSDNQQPFHDMPNYFEFGGKTELHIMLQWLTNSKNYLIHNAKTLSLTSGAEIRDIVIGDASNYLARGMYPPIELTATELEDTKNKFDQAILFSKKIFDLTNVMTPISREAYQTLRKVEPTALASLLQEYLLQAKDRYQKVITENPELLKYFNTYDQKITAILNPPSKEPASSDTPGSFFETTSESVTGLLSKSLLLIEKKQLHSRKYTKR
jgi:hemoglobin-like flavoprotein